MDHCCPPLPAPELGVETLQGSVSPSAFSQPPVPLSSLQGTSISMETSSARIPLPLRAKMPWNSLPAGRPLTHFLGSSLGSVLYYLACPCKMCCPGIIHHLSGPPRSCAHHDQSWPGGGGLRAPGLSLGKQKTPEMPPGLQHVLPGCTEADTRSV